MEKDFESWHFIKKMLDTKSPHLFLYFKPKEIWMCALGLNLGSEQDGAGKNFSRPVIVFKVFNSNTFLAISITSKNHTGNHHFKFNLGGIDQFAKISQIRTLSTRRLQRKVAVLPDRIYQDLEERFFVFIKNEIPLSGEISEAKANS